MRRYESSGLLLNAAMADQMGDSVQSRPRPATSGLDPVLVEIVEGTLGSVEREVETALGRTARSPMIRHS